MQRPTFFIKLCPRDIDIHHLFHICTVKYTHCFSLPSSIPQQPMAALCPAVLLLGAVSSDPSVFILTLRGHQISQASRLQSKSRIRNSVFSLCAQGITNERKRKLEQQLQSIMVLNRQFEHVQNFINWAVCSKTSIPFLFSKELVRKTLNPSITAFELVSECHFYQTLQ